MSNLHIPTSGIVETLGAVTGSSQGTSIGTASIAQIAASTGFDYEALLINTVANTSGLDAALDVYLGDAGAEYPLIDKIRVTKALSTNPQGQAVLVPLSVPRGSRVSARAFGASLNTIICGIGFGALSNKGFKRAVSMGITSNLGTTVNPGATANALGSWTQIVASAPHNFSALMVALGSAGRSNAALNSWLVDIGIGAAGSEQTIIKQLLTMSFSNTIFYMTPTFFGPFPCSIPAGTRISARAQSSTSSATTRNIDVSLYGLVR